MNRHDKANQDMRLKLIMILIITKCIPTLLLFLQNNVKNISQEKEIPWSPLPTLSYTHAFSFPCRPSLLHLIVYHWKFECRYSCTDKICQVNFYFFYSFLFISFIFASFSLSFPTVQIPDDLISPLPQNANFSWKYLAISKFVTDKHGIN